MHKEIEYKLQNPIEVQLAGQLITCDHLIMIAPTPALLKYVMPLKQGFFGTMKELQKSFTQEKKSTPENDEPIIKTDGYGGKSIISILYMGNADLTNYFQVFKQLCYEGSVIIKEGIHKERITETIINKLTIEDFEGLAGEYLLNFIVGSLLKIA